MAIWITKIKNGWNQYQIDVHKTTDIRVGVLNEQNMTGNNGIDWLGEAIVQIQ